MSDLTVSIKPPFKHHGPSSPAFLAEQREKALMLTETKKTDAAENNAASLNGSDAKIARGADPQEVLGLEPDRLTDEAAIDFATGRITSKEQLNAATNAENIFVAMAAEAKPEDASRDLEIVAAKEEAFVAHKQALKGYAEAAQVFQESISKGRDTFEPIMA